MSGGVLSSGVLSVPPTDRTELVFMVMWLAMLLILHNILSNKIEKNKIKSKKVLDTTGLRE